MKKTVSHFLAVFVALLLFSQCAKKGSPSGGPKDTIPPVIVKSIPENYTTNFSSDEIRIYFDEYIKLKELRENLIISPPLKYPPIITPSSTSKVLKIKISDTLKENTTYAFSFGKSIVDNNEENPYDYFKYVFSTGSYIDSLKITGKVDDALLLAPENPVTVMLYEQTENYTDSLIYNEKPTYVTVTRDSTHTFELNNLKEGSYWLVALEETSSNYTFQPREDKIGFVDTIITTPTDSSYTLRLFKEALSYKMTRPTHASKHKIIFGYEGVVDSLKITPLFPLPEGYSNTSYLEKEADSINYFFKPAFNLEETDTLYFLAKNRMKLDTLTVKLKDLYTDTLKIGRIGKNKLIPRDSLQIRANNPLVSFSSENINVMDQDSTTIPVSTYIDRRTNIASILFDKKEDQKYTVTVLPEALTDFFEQTNDTLSYGVTTLPLSDYGTITFSLENAKEFPLIVELVDSNFKSVATQNLTENSPSNFDYLAPGFYYVRIVYDTNGNKKWDSGNFLEKRQPEKVIYYPSKIEVRANWSLPETFILD